MKKVSESKKKEVKKEELELFSKMGFFIKQLSRAQERDLSLLIALAGIGAILYLHQQFLGFLVFLVGLYITSKNM